MHTLNSGRQIYHSFLSNKKFYRNYLHVAFILRYTKMKRMNKYWIAFIVLTCMRSYIQANFIWVIVKFVLQMR